MPDAKGRLTEDERRAAADFINGKAKDPDDPCIVCGSLDTRVNEFLLLLPSGGTGGSTGKAVPVLPIICHNCGFIRQFSAFQLGLIPDPPLQEMDADLPQSTDGG